MEGFEPAFLDVLRCPLTRQRLCCLAGILISGKTSGAEWEKEIPEGFADGTWLCREDGSGAYPVRLGIPVLLAEELLEIPVAVRSVLLGLLKTS